MRRIMQAVTIGCGLWLAASTAWAGGDAEWHFSVSPYVWAASLDGDVATIKGLPSADVDASFRDIIENADLAFMMLAEARRGRLGLAVDLSYLGISTDADTPGPLFDDVDLESRTFFAMLAPFYRVLEEERGFLDVYAGTRIWAIRTELQLDSGILSGRETDEREAWADPLLGARGSVRLLGPVSASAAADVGGFGASSDLTWQALGTLDFQATSWLVLRAGYRHLEVDYEDGGFEWDVAMSGPILGAAFRF